MVRICIADSSTSDAEIICNLLERELDAKRISNSIDIVLRWNEIDKAINTLPAYQIFIICIDSKCPTFDWRRLSRELRKTKSLSKIVFISDRLEDAEEIFEYCPYYFLYRPNLEYRLSQFVEKAFSGIRSGERKLFTTKLIQYAVNYDDIVFCEHVQRKTQVVCDRFTINVSEKLTNILEDLPKAFIQTHSSFIVNMDHVRGIGKNGCTMDNGIIVPVSRSRYAKTIDSFKKYIDAAID